jgi:hypothetical protein
MGDTRVRRRGWYLITHEQQEAMDPKLQPGDILLSRKNWYVSNLGLPGFWPHAILYVGDPDKFDAYFDDPAVRGHVRELSGEDLSLAEYIEHEWPARWLEFTRGDGEDPYRVIEAVSEGVIFNTLHHASGDYLVALRPRLDKLAKAQAVVHAFSELGKPYDFDFDFATDHALVCTELVWRSYRPAADKQGLDFPLMRVAGRHVPTGRRQARAGLPPHAGGRAPDTTRERDRKAVRTAGRLSRSATGLRVLPRRPRRCTRGGAFGRERVS